MYTLAEFLKMIDIKFLQRCEIIGTQELWVKSVFQFLNRITSIAITF
jgi:hypothetical protein